MRRTFLKTALAAIMATAACALAGNAAQAADLTVGANIGNVPWEFQDATGKMSASRSIWWNEIGKRLGKSVEIVNIPFKGCSPPSSPAGSTWRCPRSRSPKSGWNRSASPSPTMTATSR